MKARKDTENDLALGEDKRLPLANLINLAGDEILKANQRGSKRSRPVMEFVECEIEVGFEVELDANGTAKLFAIEFGAKGAQTTTHKMKVKYRAIEPEEQPVVVPSIHFASHGEASEGDHAVVGPYAKKRFLGNTGPGKRHKSGFKMPQTPPVVRPNNPDKMFGIKGTPDEKGKK